jgi:outer membrane translocation and assembly module TamA
LRVNAIVISIALLTISPEAFAQQKQHVNLRFFQSEHSNEKIFPDEMMVIDSSKISTTISQRLTSLYELGYLASTFKISEQPDQSLAIDFYVGKIFKMALLDQGNVSDEIMNKIGYKLLHYQDKPFSHSRIVKLFNAILNYAENTGYPFASAKLDSIIFFEDGLKAGINYRSGPLIVFDSLYLTGYNKIKPEYLMTHLGMYKGRNYEEKIISEIANKIRLLPFVRLTDDPEVIIKDGKCSVGLNLQQVKVSEVDGILGFLPNQKEGDKLLVTGQVLLDLKNLFLSGKRIAFEWQSFDVNSQLLDMLYYHPNLLKTPINIQGGFNLLKQDTTFLNRDLKLELSFITRGSSRVGFITDFLSSRLISTQGLDAATELPEINDFNLSYYGINLQHKKFDDFNMPTNGWGIVIDGVVGQKKIIKNPVINDDLYNDVPLSSFQSRVSGAIEKYWPLYKYIILRTNLTGGYLEGKNLFVGDLFRLGGLKTIRGFTEKSFYASGYGIGNLEVRAHLSRETYFLIFFDQAVVSNELAQSTDYPFGTGAGFSFNTNAGIFNFVFAMGKSSNQPFDFNYSKIHFGYISRF